MYRWRKGRAAGRSGRVRLFVDNHGVGSGQRFAGSGRVQEKWPVDNSGLLRPILSVTSRRSLNALPRTNTLTISPRAFFLRPRVHGTVSRLFSEIPAAEIVFKKEAEIVYLFILFILLFHLPLHY